MENHHHFEHGECEHCHEIIQKGSLTSKEKITEGISEKLKKSRLYIWISLIIFISAIFFPVIKTDLKIIQLLLFLTAYLIVGLDVLKKAITNLLHGRLLDENFLMTIATICAFALQEYPEAVMVMWLYKVGEWFQEYAVGKSRASISSLMNIRPDYANVEKDGKIIEVKPEEVKIGDIIIVKPGEKIPLDGIIVDGESFLDTVALTGESVPRKVTIGDTVVNGCINQKGLLKIKVIKNFEESTVAKILELVEHASERKTKAENFISKFAKYYTPIVVVAAVLLACLPPLLIEGANYLEYIRRACSFLVISCPCALVISIPLGFFSGIGGASKYGILLKGSNYIETLSKVKTLVVDKTGTLTKGVFEVTKIVPNNISKEELLEITAFAEAYSEHPIALSILNAYGKEINMSRISDAKELAGHGISVKIDNQNIYVGNKALMEKINIEIKENKSEVGTIVYVAKEEQYLGYILISDEIKIEAKEAIRKLKKENKIEQIVMLTGDNKQVANYVAKELNIDNVYAELLPQNKVEKIEELLSQNNGSIAFVGDGINDAPVLTRADIGIAMGALGADAAIEAADVVIMDDNLSKIAIAINISRRTIRIVKQNIVFALMVKLIVLILGAIGIATMWEAVFADVGVSLIAIMNSLRAMYLCKKW